MKLTVAAAVACLLVSVSAAQQSDASIRHYDLNIPKQALGAALKDFAQQTGLQVALLANTVDGEVIVGPVAGSLTPEEALSSLLKERGLDFRRVNEKTIAVVPAGTPIKRDRSTTGIEVDKRPFWERFRVAQAVGESDAVAQTESESTDPKSSGGQLEEIVVTAQKRSERLHDVPISISVVSSAQLDAGTGQGAFDVLTRVPGVTVTPPGSNGTTLMAVRGVAAGGSILNGASPIAYYLDTVPFGFVRNALIPDAAVYDLERIEALRGPQGTLYGANAQNGVVRLLTHDADLEKFDFKARASVSSTDGGDMSHREDAALNVPIIDGKLAVRGVLGYQDLGGWIDRPSSKDANSGTIKTYRLKVNAQPTDELSMGLSAWRQRDHRDAPSIGRPDGTAPNSSTFEVPITNDFDAYGLKLTYRLPALSISSMTSYLDYENDSSSDLSFFARAGINQVYEGLNLLFNAKSRVFSQEVLLNSSDESSWKWSAGAFYRDDRDNYFQIALPLMIGHIHFRDTSESYAFFGELSRRFLGDRLELTGGIRRFHDDVATTKLDPAPPASSAKASFNSTTPRIVATWYPSSQLTAYASYSVGFRSGMPQYYSIGTQAPDFPPLKPDKLHNYEIGTKMDLMDRRVTLEGAAYYIDWHDVQQSLLVPLAGGGLVPAQVNAGSASGPGFEIALIARPIEGFEFGGSFSWNALEFDDDILSGSTILFEKGSRLGTSSNYTASAFANYAFPLGGQYRGELSASANYMSRYTAHGLGFANPGDNLTMASVGFTVIAPARWSMRLYLDNITNEDGSLDGNRDFAVSTPDSPLIEALSRQRPRTVGLQLEYRLQ